MHAKGKKNLFLFFSIFECASKTFWQMFVKFKIILLLLHMVNMQYMYFYRFSFPFYLSCSACKSWNIQFCRFCVSHFFCLLLCTAGCSTSVYAFMTDKCLQTKSHQYWFAYVMRPIYTIWQKYMSHAISIQDISQVVVYFLSVSSNQTHLCILCRILSFLPTFYLCLWSKYIFVSLVYLFVCIFN